MNGTKQLKMDLFVLGFLPIRKQKIFGKKKQTHTHTGIFRQNGRKFSEKSQHFCWSYKIIYEFITLKTLHAFFSSRF